MKNHFNKSSCPKHLRVHVSAFAVLMMGLAFVMANGSVFASGL